MKCIKCKKRDKRSSRAKYCLECQVKMMATPYKKNPLKKINCSICDEGFHQSRSNQKRCPKHQAYVRKSV